jgi:H+/Cl- antiporter ClcA
MSENDPSMERRSMTVRWILAAFIVAIAVIVGVVVAAHASRTNACTSWRNALTELDRATRSSVGVGTAQLFRAEAIRRGWVEIGGVRLERAPGCTP